MLDALRVCRMATVVAGLATLSCGVEPPQEEATGSTAQAIRNGVPATGSRFSGVGLLAGATDRGTCTGSLVSGSLVLTAAQCVVGVAPGDLTFSLPTRSGRADERHRAKVTLAVPHPGFWNPEGLNLVFDLALARLEKPRSRGWDARRYPVATVNMPPRVHARLVGLGDSPLAPGQRSQGDVLVTQYVGSEGPVGVWVGDAFLELVPGTPAEQMFCSGDAGGPLLYQGEIAGVASFRSVATCAEVGPGYAVSVPRLGAWVAEQIDALDPPGACATEDDGAFATTEGGCRDLATGAVWSAPAEREGGHGGCEGLSEGGKQDWRRPTRGEREVLARHLHPAHRHDRDHRDEGARLRPIAGEPRCVRTPGGGVAPGP